jgi:small-conductance mechanosensitive channel
VSFGAFIVIVHIVFRRKDPSRNVSNGYWWDVAHVTSRHYEQEQIIHKERRLTFRRIVKICVYVIFFLVVLTSAVVSKLSLFTMINAYKTLEQVCSITN